MSKKEKQTEGKTSKIISIFVYLFAIVAVLSGIVNVVSKYVHANKEQAAVQAQEFYFESNQLSVDGVDYEISAGTNSITFELKNYPDDLRVAQVDIDFSVEVEENENVVYTTTGKLEGRKKSIQNVTFPVEQGKTYVVTATGTKGFKKDLTATFIVKESEVEAYTSAIVTKEYILLTVWTKNISGNVKVSEIPVDLIPDNTIDILKNVKQGDSEFTDTVNFTKPYSSYSYRFFRTTDEPYLANTFKVEINDMQIFPKDIEE